jgi:hypothetical protein
MVESALRSRARASRNAVNPFVVWGVLAGCLGLVLIGLAGFFYKGRSEESARARKWKRGIEILNQLTPIACDYIYARKKGALPEEVWAPFRAYEKDGDFLDAMIVYRDLAGRYEILDAARYKSGKSQDGQMMNWSTSMSTRRHHPRPRPDREPDPASVEIVEGEVTIGGVSRNVVFFRRPIIDEGVRSSLEYGLATVILFKDAPGPTGGAGPAPAKPGDTPPAVKTEAKPEEKGSPAPAAPEQKPAATDSKKNEPAPAANP